ncbi:MAG TPA: hypothetical protein DFR83_22015 [Deltaproteobacteria bacterium]|nr:hypothetical protein [Deltaproteobacteria bacterium]
MRCCPQSRCRHRPRAHRQGRWLCCPRTDRVAQTECPERRSPHRASLRWRERGSLPPRAFHPPRRVHRHSRARSPIPTRQSCPCSRKARDPR